MSKRKYQAIRFDKRIELPKFASLGAAAIDLQAVRFIDPSGKVLPRPITEPFSIAPGETVLVGSGVAIHIGDRDIAGTILPRSGLGTKKGLVVGNLVGLIDSDYQGELIVCLWNRNPESSGKSVDIQPLERIAQMVFARVEQIELDEVDAFDEESQRGQGGFGSTGG